MAKRLINTAFLIIIVLNIVSCGDDDNSNNTSNKDTIIQKDYSVVIAPDLSNRIKPIIHPKAISDTVLINAILDNSISFLDIGNRHINQYDSYLMGFINDGLVNSGSINAEKLRIDLRKFEKKPIDEANYIRTKMPGDIDSFKKEVAQIYQYSELQNNGADIWTFLNDPVHHLIKNINEEIVPNDLDKIILKQNKNILVLFTDGYIENVNNTLGYTLNQSLVDKIRNAFLASGSKDLNSFINSNKAYQLNTVNNLQGLNIMINEMDDRSKDKNGVALAHPTDFEIMKIIWIKWLKDSGAGVVDVYPEVNAKSDFVAHLKSFLTAL